MGRPNKGGRPGVIKSVYLSKEVNDFLATNASGSISSFLDQFIKAHMSETREMTAIRIKHLSEQIYRYGENE